LAGDAQGDIVLEIGGTASVDTEKVTVAKVKPSVSVQVSKKADVTIGVNNQEIGDITITEGMAEAISEDKNLEIWFDNGVFFAEKPTVEVTDGDLDIDDSSIRLTDNDNRLIIPIDNESTVASTIKISGVKVNVDRTVPVGDVRLRVGGTAVNEVNDPAVLLDYYGTYDDNGYTWGGTVADGGERVFRCGEDEGAFPGVEDVARVVVANCVTPAPQQKTATVVFKIGDNKYTVNGVEKTMDVAPYIKDGRTYVPVRYVAEAVGVPSDNIMWNGEEQSVVLMRGERVVKLTIGSNIMYVNGVAFTMDVAPELVEPGRTMLPIRWVGQALGATLKWDEATQTVTVEQQQ